MRCPTLSTKNAEPMTQVRCFRLIDAPALVALFRDTVRRINIRDYSQEQVLAWVPDDINETEWSNKLASRLTLVAEKHGQIVGFGDLESNGHLDRIYVQADHQRRGVASELLAALETEAKRRGINRIFTEASITARPFFERRGYRLIQEQMVVYRGVEFVNYQMEKQIRG